MQSINVKLYEYSELKKEAQAVVINAHIESEWYDYSDHETSEYNKSLDEFNKSFNPFLHLSGATKDEAKNIIIKCLNNACKDQAKGNEYFEESFQNKYNGVIDTIDKALLAIGNCTLTGCCTDFYVLDTISEFLKGEKYQNLSFGELITLAKQNGRQELNKQKRYFKTKKHVHSSLEEMCEKIYLENGEEAPSAITKLLTAA